MNKRSNDPFSLYVFGDQKSVAIKDYIYIYYKHKPGLRCQPKNYCFI